MPHHSATKGWLTVAQTTLLANPKHVDFLMETVAFFTLHEFIELVHVNVHLRVQSKYGSLSRHNNIIINRFLDGLKAAYDRRNYIFCF